MYTKNTIIGHLNINSIRNKFDTLDNIVKAFDNHPMFSDVYGI